MLYLTFNFFTRIDLTLVSVKLVMVGHDDVLLVQTKERGGTRENSIGDTKN